MLADCSAELLPENAGDGLSRAEELQSLLQVAQRVKGALQPVRMPVKAKRRLRTDLLESTGLTRSRDVVIAPNPPNRGVFIGAAVALAGGIAYLIHARTRAD